MGYRFRLRVDLASLSHLNLEDEELLFNEPDAPHFVRLRQADQPDPKPLSEARSLQLTGGDYATEEAARAAGSSWPSRLRRFLIAIRTGADFGERAFDGFATKEALAELAAQNGFPLLLLDTHSLTVFESEPEPRFAKLSVAAMRSAGTEQIREAIGVALGTSAPLPDRVRIAYDLMSASMSLADEARLMLLMMALETLLEVPQRSEPSLTFVDGLIKQVSESALPRDDRNSLLGAMQWLRLESIGRTGRTYVAGLEPKTYRGMPPRAFFTRCYEVRSDLVHGAVPRPTREEVDPLAADLEVMVNDLLRREIGLGPE